MTMPTAIWPDLGRCPKPRGFRRHGRHPDAQGGNHGHEAGHGFRREPENWGSAPNPGILGGMAGGSELWRRNQAEDAGADRPPFPRTRSTTLKPRAIGPRIGRRKH